MKPATLEFLKKRFSAYYNGELKGAGAVFLPTSMPQREWGFLFFSESVKAGMRRHLTFPDETDLSTYLKTMTPAHVYYSTAYYAHPSAATMQEKEWLGADLIFDLDADHIVRGSYDMMLSRVKDELYKLIDMLTGELGFAKSDLRINFSGGRGYHIHIPTIAVRSFSSAERRELVNYVSGTGLSLDAMLSSPKSTGWQGRYRTALASELERIQKLEPLAAREYLAGLSGISERTADSFYKNLAELRGKLLANPESLKDNKVIRALTAPENAVFKEAVLSHAAQADEPVTTDIKRLIRHPGSLHGGSGMRVTPIPLEDLDDFDPLIDAVVFGEEPVTVTTRFPITMPMLGNTYAVAAGTSKVPEALAVFLCARGIAELGGAE